MQNSANFYKTITQVHLEATSRCNAACPQCARNHFGGPDRVILRDEELSLEDVKVIFSPEFMSHLKVLYVNGNYGDGAVVREMLEIFEYLHELNPKTWLILFSNGGVRSPAWWSKLAKPVREAYFGIDGLADTHSIYRRGTRFEKVIENAKAFIDSGGRAHWMFNVFRHNEHQVNEAEKLSKKLGFTTFQVRKTARFEVGGYLSETFPVFNRRGEREYNLEPPKNPEFRNEAYENLEVKNAFSEVINLQQIMQYEKRVALDLSSEVRSKVYEEEFQDVEIDCLAQKEQSIYVSAGGHVFPCCWLGGYIPPGHMSTKQVLRMVDDLPGGLEFLSAKKRPIEQIVKDLFFQQVMDSWIKPGIDEGKLVTCARTCGKQKINCYSKQLT
jgi:MoaA/NifB/PqqE/SkfB family radical SAM enzyme